LKKNYKRKGKIVSAIKHTLTFFLVSPNLINQTFHIQLFKFNHLTLWLRSLVFLRKKTFKIVLMDATYYVLGTLFLEALRDIYPKY
jgi:hypothetical protein